MDPLSHLAVTRLVLGPEPRTLLWGLLPDLPWYALYPLWLTRRRLWGRVLRQGDWPLPPQGVRELHHAAHSLPMLAILALLLSRFNRDAVTARVAAAWLLHIVLDIPTHSRERMGPQVFWPLSRWAFDGLSWADGLTRWLRGLVWRLLRP